MTSPRKHALERLDVLTGEVRAMPSGGRNDFLNRAAFELGGHVGADTLTVEEARDTLAQAAQEAGLDPSEARDTIMSGLQAGAKKPLEVGGELPPKPTPYRKAQEKQARFTPLTDSERAQVEPKLEPLVQGSPAALELARRGLPAELIGAAQLARDHGQLARRGALVFNVRGPDGQTLAMKARNLGTAAELEAAGLPRYPYVVKGHSTPAWCSPNYGTGQALLSVEGELNAAAAYVAAQHAGLDLDVQGLAGAAGVPHLAGVSGRPVYVYADDDPAGHGCAARVASTAKEAGAAEVRVLAPLADGRDFCDLLGEKGPEHLAGWLAGAIGAAPVLADDPSEDDAASESKRPTSARLLDYVAAEGAELWRDLEANPFMSVDHAGVRATFRLPSTGARDWLSRLYYLREKRAVSVQALQEALGVLQAQARFEGQAYPVGVRLLAHDGRVYLDLGTEDWAVVEVSADSWRLLAAQDVPVRFWRPKTLQALTVPVPGDLAALRPFLNTDERGLCMALAWVTAALSGQGPYPILILNGEQGTGKSTASSVLRRLIDPSSAGLRSAPRDERDLYVGARNAHVLAFDNLSSVKAELSDALCRLATGGGFATRTLYSDDEETTFSAMRPMLLNGIPELAERPDLAERALGVTLERIPDDKRQDERTFWADFETARAGILGALLTAVSTALKCWDSTKLTAPPRMADFARLIVAAEPALPWEAGAFLAHYNEARRDAVAGTLESDAVGAAVRQFIDRHPAGFEGSCTDLLADLERVARVGDRKPQGWPGSARVLSGHLKRIAPALRMVGIDVETVSLGRGNDRIRGVILRPQRPQGLEEDASSVAQRDKNSGGATGGASPDGGARPASGGATGAQGGGARTALPERGKVLGGAGGARIHTSAVEDVEEL